MGSELDLMCRLVGPAGAVYAASIGLTSHVAVSCHDFLGRPTSALVRGFLAEHGFRVTGRRAEDRREWARSWLYASR